MLNVCGLQASHKILPLNGCKLECFRKLLLRRQGRRVAGRLFWHVSFSVTCDGSKIKGKQIVRLRHLQPPRSIQH